MRRSRIPAIAHALVCVTARMAPSYYSDYTEPAATGRTMQQVRVQGVRVL